jgi:hypothetical protein
LECLQDEQIQRSLQEFNAVLIRIAFRHFLADNLP